MTNKEFYKNALDSILESVVAVDKESLQVVRCSDTNCVDCLFENLAGECEVNARDWLQSEHLEQVDWSKVKVDTPIYVRDRTSDPWAKAHFAKYEKGEVCAWFGGCTSFTSEGEDDYYSWHHAKLAEN
ncbi:hypothetical protein N5B56_01520 [Eubacterium sp. LFL-14]|uniref:Uncharacterized protein n=1 Tax=Eubacterium album TaxID=2978477 RepID=A0ABT2LWU1_9FIRM|nr:hypothetical protein [Eubacterium sp. LFL-14]MCT7397765.1 hypothetical protein [Eubacterium sp. LFL-14]